MVLDAFGCMNKADLKKKVNNIVLDVYYLSEITKRNCQNLIPNPCTYTTYI